MQPILLDTNLLVYLYDQRDPKRQATALQLVSTLSKTGMGRLSTQCLSEFFSAVTRQKNEQAAILSVDEAIRETIHLSRLFIIYPVNPAIVLEALRGVKHYQISFWDAQIWAAARLNQIHVIFSEEFNPKSILEGILFVNPFDEPFDLDEWIR